MNIFSTYIQIDKDKNVANNLLNTCKKILSDTPYDEKYEYGKTTFFNKFNLDKYNKEFKPLYDLIMKNAFQYCKNMKIKNVSNITLNAIWISEMKKFGHHKVHVHNRYSELSGNFYVHTDINSSDIIFYRHEYLSDPLSSFEYEEYNEYNSNEFRVPVEKGKILIWKSDLPHSVDLNKSNSRISISFNLGIEKNEN